VEAKKANCMKRKFLCLALLIIVLLVAQLSVFEFVPTVKAEGEPRKELIRFIVSEEMRV
jgi:hypothetical protein